MDLFSRFSNTCSIDTPYFPASLYIFALCSVEGVKFSIMQFPTMDLKMKLLIMSSRCMLEMLSLIIMALKGNNICITRNSNLRCMNTLTNYR